MVNAVGLDTVDFAKEQTIEMINAELCVLFPFASMSAKVSGVVDKKMMYKFKVDGGVGPAGGGRHAYAFFEAGSLSKTQIAEMITAVHSGVLDFMAEHEYSWGKQVRYFCACPHLF
jgi:hypothetical protein